MWECCLPDGSTVWRLHRYKLASSCVKYLRSTRVLLPPGTYALSFCLQKKSVMWFNDSAVQLANNWDLQIQEISRTPKFAGNLAFLLSSTHFGVLWFYGMGLKHDNGEKVISKRRHCVGQMFQRVYQMNKSAYYNYIFSARASGVLLVAGVGSYCAYRICTKYLGQRFVYMLLEASHVNQLATADRRLLYNSTVGISHFWSPCINRCVRLPTITCRSWFICFRNDLIPEIHSGKASIIFWGVDVIVRNQIAHSNCEL